MIDNWEGRSTEMTCKSCMWFIEKKGMGKKIVGRCRRHAPTLQGYPVVFETDWCGDYKVDENKIDNYNEKQIYTKVEQANSK